MPHDIPQELIDSHDYGAISELFNKNKAFCIVPWVHLHVMPNSSVIPCCVWPYQDSFGNGTSQNVSEIWNGEKYKDLRKKMRNGEMSEGCSHCYSLEKAGFGSMRQSLNSRFSSRAEVLNQTKDDGTLKKLELRYIDIRFSNLCNFKCRGCGPDLSSSWYEDHQKLFGYKSDKKKFTSIATDAPHFWSELKAMILDAEEIYFGGGEPLITREHFEVLNILIEKKLTHVRLSYNTNLSTLNYGHDDLTDLWSKFNNVVLGLSIDDIGPRAEYFRKGTNWPVIENNIERLVNDFQQIHRYVNCTVNIHNVFYLPEIIDWLVEKKVITAAGFMINLLLDPEYYVIQTLPPRVKAKVKAKLMHYVLDCKMRKNWEPVVHNILKVIKFMEEKDSSEMMPKFQEITAQLDEIRSDKFVEVFPELRELMETTYGEV